MSKQMHIVANFDINQVSPTLECTFKSSHPEATSAEGKYAGSVLFTQGEDVVVQFNAGADMLIGGPLPFASFDVIDCTITTRPRVYRCGPNEKKTVYAPPSPFVPLDPDLPRGATVVLPAGQFEKVDVEGLPDYYQMGRLWKGNLVVGNVKARWRLTILVTVRINFTDNSAPEYRVYEIDPESEVGTGAGPGTDEEMPPLALKSCGIDPESEVGTGAGPG